MKRNIVLSSSLSLVAVLALQGCGGGGDYKASSNPVNQNVQSKFVQKDGLSGVVLADKYIEGAKVCFDTNSDGICNSTEPSEKTYEGGKFSFSKYNTDRAGNAGLIAEVNSEYILSASKKSSNQVISPFTTLTFSDMLFNPHVQGDETKALDQLSAAAAVLDRDKLSGDDYLNSNSSTISIDANTLLSSIKKAYAVDKTKPLQAIATMTDEVVKQNSLDVSITALASQTRYDSTYSLVDSSKTYNIPTQDNNQRAVGVESSDDKVIINSKWNNRLSIINSSDESVLEVKNYLEGARGTTTSGPSEKVVTKLLVASDNSNIYSMVKKDKSDNTNVGLGIYKNSFNGTNVPSVSYAAYSSTNSNFYSYENFINMNLSNDNTKLLASLGDTRVLVFNSGDLSTVLGTINTSVVSNALSFSNDSSNIYISNGNSFEVYNSTFLKTSTYDAGAAIKIIEPVSDTEVLIAFENSKNIHLLDLNSSTIQIKRQFVSSANVNKIDLSKDKKSFLVSYESSSAVSSFLVSDESVSSSVSLEKDIHDIAFVRNNRVIAISDFKAYYLDLKGEGKEPTQAEKNTWTTNHRN